MIDLSVAIPAHNEERFIRRCLEGILRSAQAAAASVEVVVALNRCTDGTRAIAESLGARCVVQDARCIASVRNAAVRGTSSPKLVTIDADTWMHHGAISSVLRRLSNPEFIGGGSASPPERLSLQPLRYAAQAGHAAYRPVSLGAKDEAQGGGFLRGS